MSDEMTNLNLRLPVYLKHSFSEAARSNGLTPSLVLRKMMEQYIEGNAQVDIFQGLNRAKK